jgi:hypothetical protein
MCSHCLSVPHASIDAVLVQEFLVCAALCDLALVDDKDLVDVGNGAEAVGDADRGTAFLGVAYGPHDDLANLNRSSGVCKYT